MSKPTINAVQLGQLLRIAQITVEFTKIDGSERLMRCTLQGMYLPASSPPVATEKDIEHTNFVVWDLDEEGWRSFRISSVISVNLAGISFSPTKSMLLG